MTKKDLFRIIIKLFGLYAVVTAFIMLPDIFFPYYYSFDLAYAVVNLAKFVVIIVLLFVLIFKTDAIIELFKLEKGFENEKVGLENISAEGLIKIGLVIIAIFFMIQTIPDITTNLFYIFKSSISHDGMNSVNNEMTLSGGNFSVLINASFKFILAYLLLSNKNKIASKIEKLN